MTSGGCGQLLLSLMYGTMYSIARRMPRPSGSSNVQRLSSGVERISADRRHRLEVEQRVAVRLGARQFLGKLPSARDLAGHQHRLETIARHHASSFSLPVRCANAATCITQHVPWLFFASRSWIPNGSRRQPGQVLGEPPRGRARPSLDCQPGAPSRRFDRAGDLDQVNGVDDADRPPGGDVRESPASSAGSGSCGLPA